MRNIEAHDCGLIHNKCHIVIIRSREKKNGTIVQLRAPPVPHTLLFQFITIIIVV